MPNGSSPYSRWIPWNASAHGDRIDGMISFLHWFMLALFVCWGAYFVYCLIKYHRRLTPRATYELPKAKISKYAEIGVIIVEGVLLVLFSMPVWANYKTKPPAPGERFEVRCIGQQFQWTFHYPGKDGKYGRTRPDLINASMGNPLGLDPDDPDGKDDIVSPELHIPINKPVYVTIRSKDVIHSFDIPVLRVKQDAIPGIEVPVWFTATMTSLEFRKAMTKDWVFGSRELGYIQKSLIAAKDHTGRDGKVILKQGDPVTDDAVTALKAAGATSVYAAPRVATEVICAQLCGNQHYKMHAPLFMELPDEVEAWMKSTTAPADDTNKSSEEEFHS